MSVSTQNSYEKRVLSGEGKEVGRVVNVVFNKVSMEANLIIFPSVGRERKMDRARGLAGSVARTAGQAASTAMAYIPGLSSVGGVAYEVASLGSQESDKRFLRKLDEIFKTYYFIPAASIKEAREDSIMLSLPLKDCLDWFSNITPAQDTDIAFFDYTYYRGSSMRMTPINLNLPAIRGKNLQDAGGASARIIDLRFDPAKGVISEIEVITAKGRKLVPMSSVKIEFNNLAASVNFDECAASTTV